MHEHLSQWWSGVSLRTKITSVTVMLLTLGLLVAGFGTMSVLRTYLVDQQDSKILASVDGLSSTIRWTEDDEGDVSCSMMRVPTEYYLAVVSSNGQLLCDNKDADQQRPSVEGLSLSRVQENDGAFTLYNAERTSQWRAIASLPSNVPVTVFVGLNLDDTN
ncbi:MAG TPA: sensor histidine kinase, partial [Glaciihabitans sp.]|nr:sensor histidine kinase [Glaciihabitans sp.]